ncbi:MAG: ribosome silencing factor [Phycisphaerae bacterium]|nr:ribosome silencing factor [Phycisphaerae bacterium]
MTEKKQDITSRELGLEIIELIRDRNCENIRMLDIGETSPITDFFIIATGTSDRQLRSLSDEIERLGKKIGQKVYKVAGRDGGDWIVMDFVDVVVHLFNEELRAYYDLELIWGESPVVEWEKLIEKK